MSEEGEVIGMDRTVLVKRVAELERQLAKIEAELVIRDELLLRVDRTLSKLEGRFRELRARMTS